MKGLAEAITRAIRLFGDQATWRGLQRAGMATDYSWARSGAAYADLYRRLKETR